MDSAKKPFYHYKKEEVNKTKPPLSSMDSTKKSPPSNHLTLTKTLSKLLHPRHKTSSFPEPLVSSSSSPSSSFRITTYTYTSEEMESLLGQLFASVSSIKAAYAQLQLAQYPYDPALIQSADLAVVTELRRVSDLKRAFVNHSLQLSSPLQSQINEQHSLLKTYKITSKQLESDVDQKDSQLISLRSELSQLNLKIRELEMKLYPGKTMASLDGLHLSGLNPTHFLCTLRFAVNSIRNFVRLMVEHMIHAGWDMDAAAKAVHPDFHKKDFNLEFLQDREKWDSTKFFDEFMSMKSLTTKEILHGSEDNFTIGFKLFLSAKYLSMVQPKMELSFFGDLDQRNIIKSCREYPNSEWFMGFAEMARRVWLLHCLFFSFGLERKASIFQVRKGTCFSEVYMENVVADESSGAPKLPTYGDKLVGFTVVPGFQVGMTLIQARVYLSGMD